MTFNYAELRATFERVNARMAAAEEAEPATKDDAAEPPTVTTEAPAPPAPVAVAGTLPDPVPPSGEQHAQTPPTAERSGPKWIFGQDDPAVAAVLDNTRRTAPPPTYGPPELVGGGAPGAPGEGVYSATRRKEVVDKVFRAGVAQEPFTAQYRGNGVWE